MTWLTSLLLINAVLTGLDLLLRAITRDPLRLVLPRHLMERDDLRTVVREALVGYGVQRIQTQALLDNMALARAKAQYPERYGNLIPGFKDKDNV